MNSIFIAKQRPLTDPVIVHVDCTERALTFLDLNHDETLIIKALAICWPGPLTIIAKAKSVIPMNVTANTGFVGIRVPNHSLALELLKVSQLPIAAPSANRFGHVSPTRVDHVLADLGSCPNLRILNGDDDKYRDETCLHGIESSVVKIDADLKKLLLLRQGAISVNRLQGILNENQFNDWKIEISQRVVTTMQKTSHDNHLSSSRDETSGEIAPGQALTHYASDIPSIIAKSIVFADELIDCASQSAEVAISSRDLLCRTILIDFNGKFSRLASKVLAYRDISSDGNANEAANRLFEVLRWTETIDGATLVLLPYLSSLQDLIEDISALNGRCEDIRDGLIDRIFRSASGRIHDVFID